MFLIIYYTVISILLYVLLLLYFRIAEMLNIVDNPNERSSHSKPTLRGGGILFYFSTLLFFVLNEFEYPYLMLGITIITIISFADDIKPLSTKIRLPFQLLAMCVLFIELNYFSLPWYLIAASIVVTIGILNAYNFMDGINGITGTYSISIFAALIYINNTYVPFMNEQLLYISTLALLVFNIFNFRKRARCFAGDVGAVSMAFLLVFLVGRLIYFTHDIKYILFFGVYGVDSVLTIIHRLILKENIFEAHRKHLYQLLANEMKIPHLYVSSGYAIIQLIVCTLTIINFYAAAAAIVALAITYYIIKQRYFHLHKL